MASRADLKHRMGSIEQTRQITRAMHLLSATRVRRDAQWVELTRSYFNRVQSTMRDILEKSRGVEHRYLERRSGNRAAFVVITGDKGLAGSYNHSVLAFAQEALRGHNCVELLAIGQIGRTFFERRNVPVNTDFVGAGMRPYLRHARRMVEHIFEQYDGGAIDELYIVYTHYHSTVSQQPRMIKLLPIALHDYQGIASEYEYAADILYEPSPQAVFDTLVPEYVIGLLFGAMVQSYVSEHTARMHAMENATHNADDMLQNLSLQYNTARQYAITQEIAEISGAAEALGQSLAQDPGVSPQAPDSKKA